MGLRLGLGCEVFSKVIPLRFESQPWHTSFFVTSFPFFSSGIDLMLYFQPTHNMLNISSDGWLLNAVTTRNLSSVLSRFSFLKSRMVMAASKAACV